MKTEEGKPNMPHKKGQAGHKPAGTESDKHDDTSKANAATHSTQKTRRLSQFSKDTPNLGHSQIHRKGHHHHHHDDHHHHHHHHHHHQGSEHGERHRRISQHSFDGSRDKGGHGHHGRARAGSKKDHDHHSVATSGDVHPIIEYENTYKLEPDAVFMPAKVKAVIKQVLEENLKGQGYQPHLMASRCMALSDIIKERVRQQVEMPRFKTIVHVLVGENKSQALSVASQCLWNKATDNFASCEYSKGNLHVVAIVFAVYQE